MQLSNYNSFEGVLYCRPHFDQLFKRTGSLDKSFEGTKKKVPNFKSSNFLLIRKFTNRLKSIPGTPKIVKPEKDEVIDIYIARTLQICCITRVRSSKITLLLEDLTRARIDIFEESEQTYIDLWITLIYVLNIWNRNHRQLKFQACLLEQGRNVLAARTLSIQQKR